MHMHIICETTLLENAKYKLQDKCHAIQMHLYAEYVTKDFLPLICRTDSATFSEFCHAPFGDGPWSQATLPPSSSQAQVSPSRPEDQVKLLQ